MMNILNLTSVAISSLLLLFCVFLRVTQVKSLDVSVDVSDSELRNVQDMCYDSSNRLWVVGTFNLAGYDEVANVAYWDDSTDTWTAPFRTGVAVSLAIQSDNPDEDEAEWAGVVKTVACPTSGNFIYFGGLFKYANLFTDDLTTLSGHTRVNNFVRYDTVNKELSYLSATNATGFFIPDDVASSFVADIECIAADCTTMYVGGYFTSVNNYDNFHNIVKVDITQGIDSPSISAIGAGSKERDGSTCSTSTCINGADGIVNDIVKLDTDLWLFGGIFSQAGGITMTSLVRYRDTSDAIECIQNGAQATCGNDDLSFAVCCYQLLGVVNVIEKVSDSTAFVGGEFTATTSVGASVTGGILVSQAQSGTVAGGQIQGIGVGTTSYYQGVAHSFLCYNYGTNYCEDAFVGGHGNDTTSNRQKSLVKVDITASSAGGMDYTPSATILTTIYPEVDTAQESSTWTQNYSYESVNAMASSTTSSASRVWIGGSLRNGANIMDMETSSTYTVDMMPDSITTANVDYSNLATGFSECYTDTAGLAYHSLAGVGVYACCPAGYLCVSSGLLAVKCDLDFGYYCPLNAEEIECCPAGYYCEAPGYAKKCPVGYFCPLGTFDPLPCVEGGLFSICDTLGQSEPRKAPSITVALLFSIIILVFGPSSVQILYDKANTAFSELNLDRLKLVLSNKKSIKESRKKAYMLYSKKKKMESSKKQSSKKVIVENADEEALAESEIPEIFDEGNLDLMSELDEMMSATSLSSLESELYDLSVDLGGEDVGVEMLPPQKVYKINSDLDDEESRESQSLIDHASASVKEAKSLEKEGTAAMDVIPRNERITLDFRDLDVTIPRKKTEQEPDGVKYLLKNVSGTLEAGKVCAVMGPSGCGKTTFLSALSNRIHGGKVGGTFLTNGQKKPIAQLQRFLGFVPQEDTMHRDLTVYQVLLYQCYLRSDCIKYPPGSQSQIDFVYSIMTVLGLLHVKDSLIGDENRRGISGGQRKRVNIGMELMCNPKILFLDEPTSGLDSTTTVELLQYLHNYAASGLNISLVIHQPRYECLQYLDNVVLLKPTEAGGRAVFVGKMNDAIEHLKDVGLPCPQGTNPTDYFLDVMSDKSARTNDKLTLEEKWSAIMDARRKELEGQIQVGSNDEDDSSDDDVESFKTGLSSKKDVVDGGESGTEPQSSRSYKKEKTVFAWNPPPWHYQLYFQVRRSIQQQYNNLVSVTANFAFLAFTGILVGALNMEVIQEYFIVTLAIGLVATLNGVKIFGGELAIASRESTSGVSVSAYFFGKIIGALPVSVLNPFAFLSLYYYISSARIYFGDIFGVLFIATMSTQALGVMISLITKPSNAQVTAIMTTLLMSCFSGSAITIRQMKDAGGLTLFLCQISYSRWCYQSLVLYNYLRESKCVLSAIFPILYEMGFITREPAGVVTDTDYSAAEDELSEVMLFNGLLVLLYTGVAALVIWGEAVQSEGYDELEYKYRNMKRGFKKHVNKYSTYWLGADIFTIGGKHKHGSRAHEGH